MSKSTDIKKARGAKSSEVSTWQLVHAWWAHHCGSCVDSFSRLVRTPLQSLLTWLVIAIAIALPASLFLGLNNIQQLGQGWQDNAQMSAFLKQGARTVAVERLQQQLQSRADIDRVEVVTPGSALQEFQQYSGLGDVLTDLDENPLPTVFIIQPNEMVATPEQMATLQSSIAAAAIVDNVQMDLGWLRRLHELLELGERVVIALATLLALGVLLVIGNTLRLAIENRRDEIVVTKMVGGTNGFVRRPFLYSGFWYGFGGGFIALILLLIAGLWLSNPVNNLISLYGSGRSLEGFGVQLGAVLLLGSGFLGWLGAWIAVSRHLKSIEPR
ncbi:MAG: permease-like cell division protein FtsX [Pseudomonadota bacterium]